MLNLFDSHTHSDNSPDGQHSVTFMCEKAVSNGLMGLAVTDHCDIDSFREDSFELRILQSVFETRKANLYFGERLLITAGIEMGQPLCDLETVRHVLDLFPYDVVLGSIHSPRGGKDYYFTDYKTCSAAQCRDMMAEYYDEVLETVRWGGFDVLAHLNYPLRYMQGRDGVECDLAPFSATIDEILALLAEAGKGLELNVSGLYGDYGCTLPQRDILARFHELGGKIVTIGSDAHRAENVGQCVGQGMEILREIGYRQFAFYKKRFPRMLEIF